MEQFHAIRTLKPNGKIKSCILHVGAYTGHLLQVGVIGKLIPVYEINTSKQY
jgi:hypothetical protein